MLVKPQRPAIGLLQWRVQLLPAAILLALLTLLALQASTPVLLSPAESAIAAVESARVDTPRSSAAGVDIVLSTPVFAVDGLGQVQVAGLEKRLSQPGAPALPYYSTLIALPPHATASVAVQLEETASQVVGRIRPAPSAGIVPESASADGLATTRSIIPQVYQPDTAIYEADDFYPAAAYTLSEPMVAGTLRVVELRLYPLRHNPVRQQLQQARRMHVAVSFSGGDLSQVSAPTGSAPLERSQAARVLNYEQAQTWQVHDPSAYTPPASPLPVGVDTFKIAIDQTGIYEISQDDLVGAGMNAAAVVTGTIAMMYQGQPVAYEFIGDGDGQFESGEKVRFYAWTFNGSRHDKNYVTDNYFWLWAGASAGQVKQITSRSNEDADDHPATNTFVETITEEPEGWLFNTWTNEWDTFPNEADLWYWERLTYEIVPGIPFAATYNINLPDPAASGPDADLEVEMLSRFNSLEGISITYVVSTTLNSSPTQGSSTWQGSKDVNVNQVYPLGDLNNGGNDVTVWLSGSRSDSGARLRAYLNRISVTYTRDLKALGDQLIFQDQAGGPAELQLSGFGEGTAANALVWDITTPTMPEKIIMEATNIQGAGPYTYHVGSSHAADARFIATTNANILAPKQLSMYVPPSLEATPGADWVAITHADFLTETNTLAAHRSSFLFGGFATHVVDVEDITNQYGFGLPLPQAIRDYLAHAYQDWNPAPGYVVLVGDATMNPRLLSGCPEAPSGCTWSQTFVPTDLLAEDRWQGFIPTDHTFVLLDGNDLIPEMAIGRIPANTAAEAADMVSKIVLFETNVLNEVAPYDNILFLADNTDSGGAFCTENANVAAGLPSSLTKIHHCLGTASNPDVATLRANYQTEVNTTNVRMVNYRGHGAIASWAVEAIATISDLQVGCTQPGCVEFWDNSSFPVVSISADCSDGHFAWVYDGLGETLVRMPGNNASAAHWSSSGLGFSFEHTILHEGFYDAIFNSGLTRIGDAANASKINYLGLGQAESEMLAFILLGDPAMQLFVLDPTNLELVHFGASSPNFFVQLSRQASRWLVEVRESLVALPPAR